jgi:hypothetical protein
LNNCTLSANVTVSYGGGANGSRLNNCVLFGNVSGSYGGGVEGSVLDNCILTDNSALNGGGAHSSTLNNSIVFFNSAPQEANHAASTLNYCCTTPLPSVGIGNISTDPQLAGLAHLSSNSPCRNAGDASYVTGTDIDGEGWANPPSIGCDEYRVGALTGSLSVAMRAPQTNIAAGFAASFTAEITGRVSWRLFSCAACLQRKQSRRCYCDSRRSHHHSADPLCPRIGFDSDFALHLLGHRREQYSVSGGCSQRRGCVGAGE